MIENFISKLPKAELHVHLEGTMTVDTVLRLAERNKISVGTREELESQRFTYKSFEEFIQVYELTTSVIFTLEDIYEVAYDYFLICAAENILYTEVSFCPALYYDLRGFTFSQVFDVLLRASRDAETNLKIKSNWILCIVKQLTMESNEKMLQDSIPYVDQIICIGIAGMEIGNPARHYEHLYKEARRIGYKKFTAHSGEFGDPRCIIDTLYHLKVNRIDHGVRCLEDPYLVQFLADSDIWLTVCPLSNHHLKVLEQFFEGNHIVNQLLEKGIKFTINSDDPPLLGGFLNKNYLTVAENFENKSEEEIKTILTKFAKDSFRASFLDEGLKEFYIKQVDLYLESLNNP